MARSSGARKIRAIALCYGKLTSDGPGGTAHMVQLAREAGDIDVRILGLPN